MSRPQTRMSEPELRRELAAAERIVGQRDEEIHRAELEIQHARVSLESVTHIHDHTAMEADHHRTDHSHDSVTDAHSHWNLPPSQTRSWMPQLDLNMSPATTTATFGGVCENEGISSLTSTSTSSIPIDRVLHRFEGLHINKKRSSVHLEDGCTSVRHAMVDDDGNYSKVPKLA